MRAFLVNVKEYEYLNVIVVVERNLQKILSVVALVPPSESDPWSH